VPGEPLLLRIGRDDTDARRPYRDIAKIHGPADQRDSVFIAAAADAVAGGKCLCSADGRGSRPVHDPAAGTACARRGALESRPLTAGEAPSCVPSKPPLASPSRPGIRLLSLPMPVIRNWVVTLPVAKAPPVAVLFRLLDHT